LTEGKDICKIRSQKLTETVWKESRDNLKSFYSVVIWALIDGFEDDVVELVKSLIVQSRLR